jgi:tRNA-dihydrouridine synthase B
MSPTAQLDSLLSDSTPFLALAPMQDVTDLPFWRLMAAYGGPDVYWTEYSRVHSTCTIDAQVLRSIVENPTGRPAIAQIIGNDPAALVKAAIELQKYPVAAIDLNLGCPAPVVYRKCAGGGLLREPKRIDAMLGALRQAVTSVKFTVKTRIGFDDTRVFDELLPIFARHRIDLLTVHGRTVSEMYRTEVRYEFIAQAVRSMPCPVVANGNVFSPARAAAVLKSTGAKGLMIGRGCIRNPWLYDQIRAHLRGEPYRLPTGRDVLEYVGRLYEETRPTAGFRERLQVEKMKKYMNFVGEGVAPEFLHRIRRAVTREDFFACCREFLEHDHPMDLIPKSNPASAQIASVPACADQ